MSSINTTSMLNLLKDDFNNSGATIIGCGAIGSKIAVELTRAGINSLELYDADIVESHNLCNQAFLHDHIGINKAIATEDLLNKICALNVETHAEFYSNQYPAFETVFLCVDSMKERRRIVEELFKKPNVTTIIETRMGTDEYRVYVISKADYEKWKSVSDYDDSAIERSPCGTTLSIGGTSSLCASTAVWQYLKFFTKAPATIEFEIILCILPFWGLATWAT